MRAPTQANIDRTSSASAAAGHSPTIHRNNIVHFPDEIEQLLRFRPSSSAAPSPHAKAPGDAAPAGGRSIARRREHARPDRIAAMMAPLVRLRALCGIVLRTDFVPRPEIFGCVVLIGILVVLMGAKSSNYIGPATCGTDPVALALAPQVDATMTVPAGTACSFWVKDTTASFDQLEVTSPPQHGTITARGRTGVIYRPERQFSGDDAFTFALRAKFESREATSLVRVRVTVK